MRPDTDAVEPCVVGKRTLKINLDYTITAHPANVCVAVGAWKKCRLFLFSANIRGRSRMQLGIIKMRADNVDDGDDDDDDDDAVNE